MCETHPPSPMDRTVHPITKFSASAPFLDENGLSLEKNKNKKYPNWLTLPKLCTVPHNQNFIS